MTVLAKYQCFKADGGRSDGGSLQMPEYLDWMPIAVKAEWFRFVGQGPDNAHYVLLESQGEQLLVIGVTLAQINWKTFKEKEREAADHIEKFIEEHGISRQPRNQ